jgi:hypothetical protein
MPHTMIPRRGCLVKTDEGYFGIVKEVHAETATVFLSNGLIADVPQDAVVGLPMKDNASEDACFNELVESYEAMERIRQAQQHAQGKGCPPIGGGN